MKELLMPFLIMLYMTLFTACGNAANETSAVSPQTTVDNMTQQIQEDDKNEPEDKDDKAADSETAAVSANDENTMSSGRDTVVVYFSATGTTKGVAERIADVTDADIYEIIPAEPYSAADLDWNDRNSRTTIEMNDPSAHPAIADDNISFDGYSTVYIGYPIWWGDAPRIMSTFVESHDFSGLTVIPFCTSGGSGIGRSGSNLASQAGSGNWLDGDRLDADISEDEIKVWISKIN